MDEIQVTIMFVEPENVDSTDTVFRTTVGYRMFKTDAERHQQQGGLNEKQHLLARGFELLDPSWGAVWGADVPLLKTDITGAGFGFISLASLPVCSLLCICS